MIAKAAEGEVNEAAFKKLMVAIEDRIAARSARKVLRIFTLIKMGYSDDEALERVFGTSGE